MWFSPGDPPEGAQAVSRRPGVPSIRCGAGPACQGLRADVATTGLAPDHSWLALCLFPWDRRAVARETTPEFGGGQDPGVGPAQKLHELGRVLSLPKPQFPHL